jgi:hypothetical protein
LAFLYLLPPAANSVKMVAKTILLSKMCKNGGENHFAEKSAYKSWAKTIFAEPK